MKNSRKFAVFLVMTLMLSLLTPMLSHLTGTNELVQAATLRLNKKSASIISGKTLTLKVIGLKKGYTVTWSSQNKYRILTEIPPDSEYVYIWVRTGKIGIITFVLTTLIMLGGACWTVLFRINSPSMRGIGAGLCMMEMRMIRKNIVL